MDMPTTQLVSALLSRTELHALVWAEPLRHLARRFGISDQCLAKLCDRFDIPRPRPGHWNKVAAGKEIAMPALPPAKAGMDETIEITPQPAGGMAMEGDPALAAARQNGKAVRVAERLSDPHPIIAGWLANRREAIARGRLVYDIWPNRPVRAAPFTPVERRRLRILDALFKALEAEKIALPRQTGMVPLRGADKTRSRSNSGSGSRKCANSSLPKRDGGMAPAGNTGENWSRRMYWSSRSSAGCLVTCRAFGRTVARA